MAARRRRSLLIVALCAAVLGGAAGGWWATRGRALPPAPSGPPPGVTVGAPPDGPYLGVQVELVVCHGQSRLLRWLPLGGDHGGTECRLRFSRENGLGPVYVVTADVSSAPPSPLWDAEGRAVHWTDNPFLHVTPAGPLLVDTLEPGGEAQCTFVPEGGAEAVRWGIRDQFAVSWLEGDLLVTQRLPRRCWLFYAVDVEARSSPAVGQRFAPVRVWGSGWTEYTSE